ncbi:P-loop NTPase [Streptomyces sp. SID8382]|uniref:P-loop NTPase n=1 Tax=Streptomyces sp. SID8382 TaxID=2690362 RepID=UPI000CA2C2E9|nr:MULTISPECIES: P-loop NTPase [unclassified Streptomyces]AUA07957.1 Chromosome-partitioning ATPase Soj [Streptomyces sp. M56]MYX62488.1 P-loop NTPase [Streptomyces sp. SID8382]
MGAMGLPERQPVKFPVIAVASGKGGVGKSSVAVAVGRELASCGRKIGVVDADVSGPNVPRMLGLRRDIPAKQVTLARWARGVRPGSGLEVMEVDGLKVASAGFLMAGSQGLALGSELADMLLSRLVNDTDWGDVDALLVDLPPGISHTQQGVLAAAGRVGVILVVTPAEVAHQDCVRALATLRELRVSVLGGVENMTHFECPCCGEKTDMHPPTPRDRTLWAEGVARLARLPFRPDATIDTAQLGPVLDAVTQHITS